MSKKQGLFWDFYFFIFSMVATMFLTVGISGFSGSRAMNLLKDSSAFA